MELKDIDQLNLSKNTKENGFIDPVALIIYDEFHKAGKILDYKERAIDRLIKLHIPFRSECNIVCNIAKRYLSINCPYCYHKMELEHSSGSEQHSSFDYKCCSCGASVILSLSHDGISVEPQESKAD